jgi:hypothetical protein
MPLTVIRGVPVSRRRGRVQASLTETTTTPALLGVSRDLELHRIKPACLVVLANICDKIQATPQARYNHLTDRSHPNTPAQRQSKCFPSMARLE